MAAPEEVIELSLLSRSDLRDIGSEAVWTLSTSKPGNGVHQLLDNNMDTYWQSDGQQPHLINIMFHAKMTVSAIALYLDFRQDESYTPKQVSIRVGTTFHDLREITNVEINEPRGWVSIPLMDDKEKSVGERERDKEGVRAHFVQAAILAMHQNGKDTHIRQVKIFGPQSSFSSRLPKCTTVDFNMYSRLR